MIYSLSQDGNHDFVIIFGNNVFVCVLYVCVCVCMILHKNASLYEGIL